MHSLRSHTPPAEKSFLHSEAAQKTDEICLRHSAQILRSFFNKQVCVCCMRLREWNGGVVDFFAAGWYNGGNEKEVRP